MRRLINRLLYGEMWCKLRHDLNGMLLQTLIKGGTPVARVRIPRPGRVSGWTVIKDVPFSDVLFITHYPSRLGRLLGLKPKSLKIIKHK